MLLRAEPPRLIVLAQAVHEDDDPVGDAGAEVVRNVLGDAPELAAVRAQSHPGREGSTRDGKGVASESVHRAQHPARLRLVVAGLGSRLAISRDRSAYHRRQYPYA